MASRAAFSRSTSTSSATLATRVKSKKAKCPDNQKHVDKLHEKLQKLNGASNYKYVLQRALKNVVKHKEAIRTYKDALQIDGVGPQLANLIVPEHQNVRNRARTSSPLSQSSTASTTSQRKRPASTVVVEEGPSKRERRYQTALQVAQQEEWRNQGLIWRVKLLVDIREGKAGVHFISKCRMSGIPCEEEVLPIGDMCWLAEGLDPIHPGVKARLLLGTIVERKTTPDLKSSLFGTRYNEQSLRLQNSGLPQVLFLIEGDLNEDLTRCPADTLQTAAWCLRLHHGFSLVQTKHLDDTVLQLKRMHRRILQRTFPTAFYGQALPSFAEPDSYRRRRSSGSGRRCFRRPESLMGLTFDTDPVLMPGYRRFITFEELVSKVELDRERGTRRVGHVHAAMLKQVHSLSDKKCQAIARVYPTVNCLMNELSQKGLQSKSTLQNIEIQNVESTQVRKLGETSAREMLGAYWTDGNEKGRRKSSSSQGSDNQRTTLVQHYHETYGSQPLEMSLETPLQPQPDDDTFSSQLHKATKPSGPTRKMTGNPILDGNVSSSEDDDTVALEGDRQPVACRTAAPRRESLPSPSPLTNAAAASSSAKYASLPITSCESRRRKSVECLEWTEWAAAQPTEDNDDFWESLHESTEPVTSLKLASTATPLCVAHDMARKPTSAPLPKKTFDPIMRDFEHSSEEEDIFAETAVAVSTVVAAESFHAPSSMGLPGKENVAVTVKLSGPIDLLSDDDISPLKRREPLPKKETPIELLGSSSDDDDDLPLAARLASRTKQPVLELD